MLASNIFSSDKDNVTDRLSTMLKQGGIDWAVFFCEGIKQRYIPAVYYNLSQLGLLKYIDDASIVKRLETSFNCSKERSSKYIEEMNILFNSINCNNIKAVFLKGEVLSLKYYPHPATRPFDDCDLLLNTVDIRSLEKILLENGYTQGYGENGEITLPSRKEIFFARMYMKHIIAYVKYKDNMLYVIEPHYNLLWRNKDGKPAFSWNMNGVIERACEVELEGIRGWKMKNEDFLTFLCIDIYEDANRIEKIAQGTDLELIKFLDTYSIIHNGVDWRVFVEDIIKLKMESPAYFTLSGLNELYNIVPSWVLERIKPESTAYIDEFGFPEELKGEQKCIYKRSFFERFFDYDYRQEELNRQLELCRNTTFQNLKN